LSSLLAETIPLALAAAVSPVVFLLQIATLTGERRLARGAALAAGAALPLLAVAILVVSVGEAVSLPSSPTAKGVIDIVLGCLLLALAVVTIARPPSQDEKPKRSAPAGLGRSFALGAAAMATNVTTFAFFVPAVKQIASSSLDLGERASVGVVTLAITLIPALVPLVLSAAAPGAAGRALSAVGRFMHDHNRATRIVLGLGFGAWLVLKGIGEL
jgi:threonine/homoserine/homoserine lactone efflux protein